MNDQKPYLILEHPHAQNPVLIFKQKTLSNKEIIYISHIKIKNPVENNQSLAFKVMSTAAEQIKSYPFVGILKIGESKTIKLITKETSFDKAVKVRIVSMNIDKPQEIKDQYEIMDQFKLLKDQIKDLPSIILQVQEIIQSESVSYITQPSDRRIPMFTSHVSQIQNGESTPASAILKSVISQRKQKDSLQISQNFQMEQTIMNLQDQQQALINETRELNKQIVLFKAKQNIPFEDEKDDQVKFTMFQLIVIAFISLLIGFYMPEF
ncbi:unnamed protein product [Paramecium pentaurelia]|uniref:MSP domain-containing protein n=1 Tax=Paramecium pentaurelia TaxID=43138 RepID=A0A8S1UJ15_9CILI|nr:unnamed protein product [Paramecium pentaurelia]